MKGQQSSPKKPHFILRMLSWAGLWTVCFVRSLLLHCAFHFRSCGSYCRQPEYREAWQIMVWKASKAHLRKPHFIAYNVARVQGGVMGGGGGGGGVLPSTLYGVCQGSYNSHWARKPQKLTPINMSKMIPFDTWDEQSMRENDFLTKEIDPQINLNFEKNTT